MVVVNQVCHSAAVVVSAILLRRSRQLTVVVKGSLRRGGSNRHPDGDIDCGLTDRATRGRCSGRGGCYRTTGRVETIAELRCSQDMLPLRPLSRNVRVWNQRGCHRLTLLSLKRVTDCRGRNFRFIVGVTLRPLH